MSLSKTSSGLLGTLSAISAIAGTAITAISVFYPELISSTTKQAINFSSYVAQSGVVRSAVVSAQVNCFLYAVLLVVLLMGFALAGYFYLSTAMAARALATGNSNSKWPQYLVLSFVVVLCVALGNTLPAAIFKPTNPITLAMEFNFAAWALKSRVGSFALGFIIFFLAVIVAVGTHLLLVELPRSRKITKTRTSIS